MNILINRIIKYNELIIWIGAVIALYIITPSGNHFTLCPLSNLGFEYCPGCGLGKGIHHILHGELNNSIDSHFLAIPALVILLNRIYKLSLKCINESYRKSPV
ncbi:DUF2752 domain-containing protein [Mangrovivirga cuniculi]|uniref:DUF2752 domain-containing protein n=1 Tax=Mangrovivirga cuniculi TaxID=2715131 RepID=A0A4D7JLF6_9BACT|nr:DUF2752 domain-containing protein [Mangrovivirga cuniculi]QCK16431.1 DUF2752 domain-containing protein [Mangrovivirga cuniculi]